MHLKVKAAHLQCTAPVWVVEGQRPSEAVMGAAQAEADPAGAGGPAAVAQAAGAAGALAAVAAGALAETLTRRGLAGQMLLGAAVL